MHSHEEVPLLVPAFALALGACSDTFTPLAPESAQFHISNPRLDALVHKVDVNGDGIICATKTKPPTYYDNTYGSCQDGVITVDTN